MSNNIHDEKVDELSELLKSLELEKFIQFSKKKILT